METGLTHATPYHPPSNRKINKTLIATYRPRLGSPSLVTLGKQDMAGLVTRQSCEVWTTSFIRQVA